MEPPKIFIFLKKKMIDFLQVKTNISEKRATPLIRKGPRNFKQNSFSLVKSLYFKRTSLAVDHLEFLISLKLANEHYTVHLK